MNTRSIHYHVRYIPYGRERFYKFNQKHHEYEAYGRERERGALDGTVDHGDGKGHSTAARGSSRRRTASSRPWAGRKEHFAAVRDEKPGMRQQTEV